MKIGFVGLGKLGLPVALAVESKGYEVYGYDINPDVANYLKNKQIPFKEEGLQPLLEKTNLNLCTDVESLVAESDIVFVPIQTPHEPQFEGATRIPNERADFDYTWLKEGIKSVAEAASKLQKHVIVVVISTCLPGTYNREIKPLLNEYIHYVYGPQFIAMGTVLKDYLEPEFSLIGVEDEGAARQLQDFFKTIHNAPHLLTDITTAEAIKVSYNTFITMKTVLANTWGELAHKVGANVDDIYRAWSMSTDRLISPKYLKAGQGDGGGCHPRDNIALSYIAKQVGLSHNIFEDLMAAREDHAEWVADLCLQYGNKVTILGKAFKPETNIETGSPAVLEANILREKGAEVVHVEDLEPTEVGVYLIGTQHARYKDYKFPAGSAVIDPFRYLDDQDGVEIVKLGLIN